MLQTRGLGTVLEPLSKPFPFAVEFRILGYDEARPGLETKVRALGLESIVKFLGFVPYDGVACELNKSDVSICRLPDRIEWNVSCLLKVLKYMA